MAKNSLIFSRKTLFLINLAFWTVLAILAVLMRAFAALRMGEEFMWSGAIIGACADYYALFLLSFVIYALFLRTYHKAFLPFLLIHLPISLVLAVFNLAVSILINMTLTRMIKEMPTPYWEAFGINMGMYLGYALNGIIMYWLVIICLFALTFYSRYKNQQILAVELESKLNQSQLQTLKMQLQPHFLFNALNTIAMMVRNQKGAKAVDMISGLSELLRESLSREGEQFVKFEDEIGLLKKYLEIEQVRFQDRLSINLEIDPASKQIPFPSLLLQPLLENAFKHGIGQSMEDSILSIKSEVIGDELHVWIDNNGPTLPENWRMEDQTGIGLRNTQSRLEQLYGDQFSFSVFNLSLTGVSVHVIIPGTTPES